MAAERSSITRVNINGDRGHPCLMPLVIEKELEVRPEVQSLADRWEYSTRVPVSRQIRVPEYLSPDPSEYSCVNMQIQIFGGLI